MSSLCKLYFRELPNPLLTYQLYGKFSVSKGAGGTEGAGTPLAQTSSHLPTISGGHVSAWGGGASGAGARCHPAAAPATLQVNQEGQGGTWWDSKGVEAQVSPSAPTPRTLEYLLRHLARMARHSANTSMHARNLAIVWAPNLLR